MSYILDALKRAERERKQGQVSVLDEVPSAMTGERRLRGLPRGWLAVLGAIVVSALLAYALIAWRHHGASNASVPPAATDTEQPAATQDPAPPPRLSPAGLDGAAPAPAATIEDGSKVATLDDVSEPPPPEPAADAPPGRHPELLTGRQSRQRPTPPPAENAQQATKVQEPGSAPPEPAAESTAGTEPGPAPIDAVTDTAATAAAISDRETAAPDAQAPSAPSAQGRQLRQMPEEYRANFPAFTVDVHAYDDSPRKRFVMIGGKRYHEGDALAEGPRVIAIVPEGIVLDWQGQQVLYAIAR